jgi:hypothetical protein
MLTWMIWTDAPVTNDALRQFTNANDGYWNEAVGDEGVIERGEARVFISTASATDQNNVMSDDLAFATSQMGSVPASMLSVRIGHSNGSIRLAEDIATKVISAWGGFLDRNVP